MDNSSRKRDGGNDASIRLSKNQKLNMDLILHSTIKNNPSDLKGVQQAFQDNPDSIYMTDDQNHVPIHLAILGNSSYEVLKFLLEKDSSAVQVDMGGNCYPLHMAIRKGYTLDKLKLLLNANHSDMSHAALLHKALDCRAELDVLEELVRVFPDSIIQKDEDGVYPLLYALDLQLKSEIIAFLLQKDTSNTAVQSLTEFRDTVLVHALEHNASMEVIKMIYEAHPPALKNRESNSGGCLHVAIRERRDFSLVKFLYELDPLAIYEQEGDEGNLPLHLAGEYCVSVAVIKLLVNKYPSGLSIPNQDLQSPIQVAIQSGCSPVQLCAFMSNDYDITDERLLRWAVGGQGTVNATLRWILSCVDENTVGLARTHENLTYSMVKRAIDNEGFGADNMSLVLTTFPNCDEIRAPHTTQTKSWSIQRGPNGNVCFSQTSFSIRVRQPDSIPLERVTMLCCEERNIQDVVDDLDDDELGTHFIFKSPFYCSTLGRILDSIDLNMNLKWLGLSNHPIGDEGAKLVALLLKKFKSIVEVNLQNCGIGYEGLHSLVDSSNLGYLVNLDLSHNLGIVNGKCGLHIGRQLSRERNFTIFHLYGCGKGDKTKHREFMENIMAHIRFHPNRLSSFYVDGLTVPMYEAIHFYRSDLHIAIMGCNESVRANLWHFILDTVHHHVQNVDVNVDVMFFFVKEIAKSYN